MSTSHPVPTPGDTSQEMLSPIVVQDNPSTSGALESKQGEGGVSSTTVPFANFTGPIGAPEAITVYHDVVVLKLPDLPADMGISVEFSAKSTKLFGATWLPWEAASGRPDVAKCYTSLASKNARAFVCTTLEPERTYRFRVLILHSGRVGPESVPVTTVSVVEGAQRYACRAEGEHIREIMYVRETQRLTAIRDQALDKLQRANAEVVVVKETIGKVTGERDAARTEVEELRKIKSGLEASVSAAKATETQLKANISLLQGEKDELSSTLAALQNTMRAGDSAAKADLATLSTKLSAAEEVKSQLTNQCNEKDASITTLQGEVAALRTQIESLNQSLTKLTESSRVDKETSDTRAQSLMSELHDCRSQLDLAQSALKEAHDTIEDLTNTKATLQDALAASEVKVAKLSEEVAMEKTRNEVERGVPLESYSEVNSKLAEAEVDLINLKEAHQAELEAISKKHQDQLRELLAEKQSELEQAMKQLADTRLAVKGLRTDLQVTQKRSLELDGVIRSGGSNNSMSTPLLRADSVVLVVPDVPGSSSVRQELDQLTKDCQSLSGKYKQGKIAMAQSKARIETLERNVTMLTKELSDRGVELEAAKSSVLLLQADVDAKKQAVSRLEGTVKALSEQLSVQGEAGRRAAQLEAEVAAAANIIEQLKAQIVAQGVLVKLAEETKYRLSTERDDALTRVQALTEEAGKHQAQYVAEKTLLEAEVERVMGERDVHVQAIARLEREVAELRAQVEKAGSGGGGMVTDQSRRIAQLEALVQQRTQELEAAVRNFDMTVEEVNRLTTEFNELNARYTSTVARMNRLDGIRTELYRDMDEDIMAKFFEGFPATAATAVESARCYMELRRAGFVHEQSKQAVLRYPNSPELQFLYCGA